MISEVLSHHDCDKFLALVEQSEKIIVVGHQNPDGDALGAVLGFSTWLRLEGKDPWMVLPDAYPDFLQWMPLANNVVRFDKHPEDVERMLSEADLLVCLDFNEFGRVGDKMEPVIRTYEGKVIHIDHHIGPQIKADITVSCPTASSTCELIFKLIWQIGDFNKLDRLFNIPIYTGMMTDTGSFEYANTTPETFAIVCELMKRGVDRAKIHRNVYDTFSLWRLRLQGFVLFKKLVVMPKLHASYFTLAKEDLQRFHFIKGDAEGLVNLPLQMKGHKLSISLREDTVRENLIWVSTRSIDDIPCNEICAKFFNGGGHTNASGGRLNCSMEEAIKIAEEAIRDFEDVLTK